jgi:hypothetical protein
MNTLPENEYPVVVIDSIIKTVADKVILESWKKFLLGKGYCIEVTTRNKNTILRRNLSEIEKEEIIDGTDWKFFDSSFQYQHGI